MFETQKFNEPGIEGGKNRELVLRNILQVQVAGQGRMDSGHRLKGVNLPVIDDPVVSMEQLPQRNQHQDEGKCANFCLEPLDRRVHCGKCCVNITLCTRRPSRNCFTFG